MKKTDLLQTARQLLRESFEMQYGGAVHERFAKALGYADGYMRALQDAGLATKDQLRALVADERGLALRSVAAQPTADGALALT